MLKVGTHDIRHKLIKRLGTFTSSTNTCSSKSNNHPLQEQLFHHLKQSMTSQQPQDVPVQWNLFTEKNHTRDYAVYRPNYPTELIQSLFRLAPKLVSGGGAKIVDVGCGSGQLTLQLGELLLPQAKANEVEIIGLDPSANQIENAKEILPESLKGLIKYGVSGSEKMDIESGSVDIVTVAQALHWFDLDAFFAEVDRVLKPNGVLAVITYDLNQFEQPEAQSELLKFYNGVLGKYWSPKRRMVDEKYTNVNFPYSSTLKRSVFPLHKSMTVQNYINYLNTWSSIQKYRQENPNESEDLLERFKRDLMPTLGATNDQDMIDFVWPMYLITVQKQ